ncbi:unnamed protein product [Urochloa decumbens]|uniref:Rieske domain-containing protein n=1 Tax=Urochloa decumbens TaxID=240449 RepID=A0ABC8Y5A0_9POAL
MDLVSLLLLPRASRPFGATAAPSRSTGPGGARVVLPRRRLSLPVLAVARDAPRADEAPAPSVSAEEEQFDWLDQWYPFAPVGELDPRAPHGKTVLGLAVVAWYDRAAAGGGEWRVFADACPHRLAPLSEGRIDGEGRLHAALKAMKALEITLQATSVAVVGFLAVAKGMLVTSVVQKTVIVSAAVLCFAASRWLASFIEKNFYFEDYVHAYK